MNGYRVLGCAYKDLTNKPLSQVFYTISKIQSRKKRKKITPNFAQMQQEPRASLEKDLTFLGFLVMGNQLKPETKAVRN